MFLLSPFVLVVTVRLKTFFFQKKKNKYDERAELPNLFYELFTQKRPDHNRTRRE